MIDKSVFEAAEVVGIKNPSTTTVMNPKIIYSSFDFTMRTADDKQREMVQRSLGILVKNILAHNSKNPKNKIELKDSIGFKGCRTCSCVGFRFNTSVAACSNCSGKGKVKDRLKHEVICLDCNGTGKRKRFSFNNTTECPDCQGLGTRQENKTFGTPLAAAFEKAKKLK